MRAIETERPLRCHTLGLKRYHYLRIARTQVLSVHIKSVRREDWCKAALTLPTFGTQVHYGLIEFFLSIRYGSIELCTPVRHGPIKLRLSIRNVRSMARTHPRGRLRCNHGEVRHAARQARGCAYAGTGLVADARRGVAAIHR